MVTDGGVQREWATTDLKRHTTETLYSLLHITVMPQNSVNISVLLPQVHLKEGLTGVCCHSDPPEPEPKEQLHQAGDKTQSHLQAVVKRDAIGTSGRSVKPES